MAGGGGASSGVVDPPLSQAYGYGIVVGLGFLFALGMILTTWVLKRYVMHGLKKGNGKNFN
jgi:multisubunit Na+/H+ antiporter MnhB subunit